MRTDVNTSVHSILGKESVLPLQFLALFASLTIWLELYTAFFSVRPFFSIFQLAEILASIANIVLLDAICGLVMVFLHRCNLPGSRLWFACFNALMAYSARSNFLFIQVKPRGDWHQHRRAVLGDLGDFPPDTPPIVRLCYVIGLFVLASLFRHLAP